LGPLIVWNDDEIAVGSGFPMHGHRGMEFNKGDVPLKVYQIWLLPRVAGGEPRWDTKRFPKGDRSGHFVVLASGFDSDEGALPIRANARLLGATIKAGERIWQALSPSRCAYLAVASGRIEVNGELMGPLDGAAITKVPAVEITALEDSELVMVDTGQV
jgi:redox-sensitive bicupin YhaK (pirin superfamily)